MGSYESRPRKSIFETLGALAASALIVGGASAQEQQRPKGRPITQAQFEATLSPAERAEREAYRRRAQTDPEIIALQIRMAQAERQQAARCNQIQQQINREGYTTVEGKLGGMALSDCGLLR